VFLFGQRTPTAADVYLLPFLYRLPMLDYFRATPPPPRDVMAYAAAAAAGIVGFEQCVPKLPELKARLQKAIPRLPVMANNQLQHEAIRAHSRTVRLLLTSVADASIDRAVRQTDAQHLGKVYPLLVQLIEQHAAYEDSVLWPVFEASRAGITAQAHQEHAEEAAQLRDTRARVLQLAAPGGLDLPADAVAKLVADIRALLDHMEHHMLGEETDIAPIAQQLPPDQMVEIMLKVFSMSDPLLEDAFILQGLSGPQLEQYVHGLAVLYRERDPPHFKALLNRIRTAVNKAPWQTLQERLPDIAALVN